MLLMLLLCFICHQKLLWLCGWVVNACVECFIYWASHSNRPRVQLSFCKCNFTISCNVFELVGNELLSKSLQNKMEKSMTRHRIWSVRVKWEMQWKSTAAAKKLTSKRNFFSIDLSLKASNNTAAITKTTAHTHTLTLLFSYTLAHEVGNFNL